MTLENGYEGFTAMSVSIPRRPRSEIVYPDTDGKPMADNTLQFRWIVTIKEGLDRVYRRRSDVFVAGDLLWYPVEGKPKICAAPDALVAIGRPKGDRGSYKQWEEGGIAPQVVFEVLSPNNRVPEMERKLEFYDLYGVQEYEAERLRNEVARRHDAEFQRAERLAAQLRAMGIEPSE